jgi:hypothetical protein
VTMSLLLLHLLCAHLLQSICLHTRTGMRISIKRCPLMRMAGHQDLTWEVTDWLQSVVHPTYNLMGECLCWLVKVIRVLFWLCTLQSVVHPTYKLMGESQCVCRH